MTNVFRIEEWEITFAVYCNILQDEYFLLKTDIIEIVPEKYRIVIDMLGDHSLECEYYISRNMDDSQTTISVSINLQFHDEDDMVLFKMMI